LAIFALSHVSAECYHEGIFNRGDKSELQAIRVEGIRQGIRRIDVFSKARKVSESMVSGKVSAESG
jgi:hypothetical protein